MLLVIHVAKAAVRAGRPSAAIPAAQIERNSRQSAVDTAFNHLHPHSPVESPGPCPRIPLSKKHGEKCGVGVFDDATAAQRAVHELQARGFREDQIGVATRGEAHLDGATELRSFHGAPAGGVAIGAATGATIGALWGLGIVAGALPAVGPAIAGGTLAAILSSAAAGAAVAGVAGALVEWGISEEDAQFYDREFRMGRTIVTVHAGERREEVADLLRSWGASGFPPQGNVG